MTTSSAPQDPIEPDARLANKATFLTLVSLASLMVALLSIPLTFQKTEAAAARAVASAPLAVGVGAGVRARSARAQLRALRDEQEAAASTAAGARRG